MTQGNFISIHHQNILKSGSRIVLKKQKKYLLKPMKPAMSLLTLGMNGQKELTLNQI
jgi:hypothetical protein